MARKIILILFVLYTLKANAQNSIPNYEIGYLFDINNQMIDGFFDFDYEPTKSLTVRYSIGQDKTPGYYYNLQNQKVSGYIKLTGYSDSFDFSSSLDEKTHNISSTSCKAFVIGVDSFVVIQNFPIQKEIFSTKSSDKEFAEVIESFDGINFYKHISNGITTFLYKYDSLGIYMGIPKQNTKYQETITKLFGEVDPLKRTLNLKMYDEQEILSMIKMLKYKRKYNKGEKIFYNSSWDEIENPQKSTFYATIKSINNTSFEIAFFYNNGIPIYEGFFTSFYPHKKYKEFTWFYPNGSIRKKVNFFVNKPQKTTTFFKNGGIHRIYKHIFNSSGDNKKILFEKIYSNDGKDLLDSNGNGIETYFDSISSKSITYEYEKNELVKAYYFDSNNRKIYQYCEKSAKLKDFIFLNASIKKNVEYPLSSILSFNHGFALIKCIVEPNGMTYKFEFIKNIDKDCDEAIFSYLIKHNVLNEWKPAKEGGENVAQEIVIPIDFSIESFSRYRSNYNYYWMMQNQMMMRPVNFQPQIQAPSFR